MIRSRCCPVFLTVWLLCAGLLSGCGSSNSTVPGKPETSGAGADAGLKSLTGTVKVDGSSTLQPVSAAVAEDFQDLSRVKVTVGISGTGGGFKKFCRGEIDVADASRPILQAEMDAARENKIEFIELPVCFDALTVAVNPANPLTSITVAELKKMWEPEAQGKITKWNQVNSAWPDAELTLYGAGTDSGTFDYFTEAICGKAKLSRSDYGANENDNVIVQGIAGNEHALGYLPFAYYIANKSKLKALAVDWEKSDTGPVPPSLENVLAGKYSPLSRPLFIYVNRQSAERPEVQAFVEFYLKNAHRLAGEVHYLPLPERAYEMAMDRFKKLRTGSGFAGSSEVGLTVEEILQREPKQ